MASAFHGAKKQDHACFAQPGRAQVEVHIARPQPDPIRRRQMPDRIAVAMCDQLRLGRGPGGEIQQQRVVGGRRRRHIECRRPVASLSAKSIHPGTASPTAMRMRRARQSGEMLPSVLDPLTMDADPAARETILEIRALCSSVVAGMITAPSFIAASMVSHKATTLPSMTSTRSPATTPCAARKLATWLDRRARSA